ncbi:MAG TPA: hypothetical protein DD621_04155, partial [Clostridiales bacterium]|nr:hypothetical protein [Clostridiales bacterium]
MEIMGLNTAFEKKLLTNAKKKCKTIVLPEAGINEQVLLAGLMCAENKIAKIVMLVSDNTLIEKHKVKESDYLRVVDINTSELLPMLVNALYLKRKEKGFTEDGARDL